MSLLNPKLLELEEEYSASWVQWAVSTAKAIPRELLDQSPLFLKKGGTPVERWDDDRLEWLGENLYEGQECDNESFVVFSRHGGAIVNERTRQMRRFPRLPNGAYEIEMWLPPVKLVEEAGFPRQGRSHL